MRIRHTLGRSLLTGEPIDFFEEVEDGPALRNEGDRVLFTSGVLSRPAPKRPSDIEIATMRRVLGLKPREARA